MTLVELLVVIVILAIAAAVVVPHVASSSDLEVISAARVVAADLQYAQSIAIASQVPVTVTFDTAAESYALSNQSGTLTHPITKAAYAVDFSSGGEFGSSDRLVQDLGKL